jgi:acyl carrier protein
METRDNLLERVRKHFPFPLSSPDDIQEGRILADLGLTSLHLLTLVLTLQREYGFDIDQLADIGMPVTVGAMIDLMAPRDEVVA